MTPPEDVWRGHPRPRIHRWSNGGWPAYRVIFILEGGPSKLRLGGGFPPESAPSS